MKAIWLENQELSIRNTIPNPQPKTGEVLIRVRMAGICSTDLELVKGYYPFAGILGHEFVGEVLAAPGNPSWRGKRVVGEINIVCGRCETCLVGRSTHCENRSVLGIKSHHGAFAEYLTLPLENLHAVPDSVPDEKAVFVEPIAAAFEILEQIEIKPTDRVLVVGAGRLGQLVAQALALTGCDLQVVARHDDQRKILIDRQIRVIAESDVKEKEVDIAVDATGSPAGFSMARCALRPRGTLVVKSTYADNLQVNFSSIVVDELTVIGSRCGPFEPAIRALESGDVDPSPLISARYPLVDGLQAFERAAQPGALKVLLSMEKVDNKNRA